MKRMGLPWVADLLRSANHEVGLPALKTVTASLTDEEWGKSLKDVSWIKWEKIERQRWAMSKKHEFAKKAR
jgi:hypothetical protein